MKTGHRTFRQLPLWACLCAAVACFAPSSAAQEYTEQEVVANLASGRAILCVAKDGIVLATFAQSAEPGSLPPAVMPLGGVRMGILLGAVEWEASESGKPPVRLDAEVPRLVAEAAQPTRRTEPFQASDIEAIGVAVLERVRELADQFHHKLDLGPEEPLVELILADYQPDYGPEVWDLRYRVEQDDLGNGYWRTRVLRPSYNQLYPPEKHQPHELVEVRYPDSLSGPKLSDLLQQNDPRLAPIRDSDPKLTKAAEQMTSGETQKSVAADDAEFLRAALPVLAGAQAKFVVGTLYQEGRLAWLVAPPEIPRAAGKGKENEPGRPTLLRKPHP